MIYNMCLYPRLILNRKYLPNKKNNQTPPELTDDRVKYVAVGCGKCMECMNQRRRQWQVRLHEELKHDRTGKFITLSFSEEALEELQEELETEGYQLENDTATIAVRRFLERWRKKTGKSVKHWLVTELGHKNTERIHIHGIIFTDDINTLRETWQYGNIWTGSYVNERTVNYIVKYISKTDIQHKAYKPVILTSPGIGNKYIEKPDAKRNTFKDKETNEMYTTRQGIKLPLPTYYRNKIYSDEQREKLWINLLDKQVRYVNGLKVDISKGEEDYYKTLQQMRRLNRQLGYGDNETNWKREQYELERRKLIKQTRQEKLKLKEMDKNGHMTKEEYFAYNKQLDKGLKPRKQFKELDGWHSLNEEEYANMITGEIKPKQEIDKKPPIDKEWAEELRKYEALNREFNGCNDPKANQLLKIAGRKFEDWKGKPSF